MGQDTRAPLSASRRVGVIGDIHTELDVLQWAIRTLRAHEAELVFAVGDIADGPHTGDALNQCCAVLAREGVHTILGNHDRWLLDNEMRHLPDATFPEDLDDPSQRFLRGLPASLEVETPLGLMLVGHGIGSDDMATFYPHDHGPAITGNKVLQALLQQRRYRLLAAGHTHRRMVRAIDGITVINAGTLLQRRDPCCVLIDFETKEARFYDYVAGGETREGPRHPL
jgi:predicted phosphodiesterase